MTVGELKGNLNCANNDYDQVYVSDGFLTIQPR